MNTSTKRDEAPTDTPGQSVLEQMSLRGRTALVTGGGNGIGRGCAHALGEAGARVAVLDLDPDAARTVAEELQDKGIDSLAFGADVRDPAAVEHALRGILNQWGRLTVAVNSSGIIRNSPAELTTLDEWAEILGVNLTGMFVACQVEGRAMLNEGYGSIINIVSTASLVIPHPQKQAAYNASKWGLLGLTKSLASEWSKRGVRVNALSPGVTDTGLFDNSPGLRAIAEQNAIQTPSGRVGQVTDLYGAVAFLASPSADFVSGSHLVVDGGASII
ncbi:SDR family oxidoreductase [Kribbella yunnanensis]|uniref:SDR family oxidoreductase n=1 Tax=Kribbella yunnanensis TaxID=190194 RepID=A0ABP4UVQ9_9ACTN